MSLQISIGAPAPDRKVIVVVSSNDGVYHAINGAPTLDGVPMTPLYYTGNTRMPSGVWIANRPDSATTATLYFIGTSGNADGQAVVSLSMYGASSLLPDFSMQPGNASATIDWPGTKVLGVWFNWQSGTPHVAPPWEEYVHNLYTQGFTSVAVMDMDYAVQLPSFNIPYNGGTFFAAWR